MQAKAKQVKKRRTLRDVIAERLTANQESVLHVLKHYPKEPHRSWNLERSLHNNIQRTVDAVLAHFRSVEVEERRALELWEADANGSSHRDTGTCGAADLADIDRGGHPADGR